MSELTANTITESNADIYDRLLVSIEAGVGTLQLFVAVCDADRQREEIISNYEQELSPNLHTYRANLDPQEPSLRRAVASVVTETNHAIVTVLGAETLGLSVQGDEILDKFFGYLQWTREALREFQMPIVLWVPSRIFKQLAKKAPDFWSWRAGVFQFKLELVETSINVGFRMGADVTSSIIDERVDLNLSVEQLEASLGEAIAKWGVNNHHVATLYSQLGSLYAQRVQSGKSVNREGEIAIAQEYLERASKLQTKFQQPLALVSSLDTLAILYQSQHRWHEAIDCYQMSLIICRDLGDRYSEATTLKNLGNVYNCQSRWQEAIDCYQMSLIICRDLGDRYSEATTLKNLGNVYNCQSRWQEAIDCYEMSLIMFLEVGDGYNQGQTLSSLVNVYKSMGRYAEAEALCVQILEIAKKTLGDNHPHTKICQGNLESLRKQTEISKPG